MICAHILRATHVLYINMHNYIYIHIVNCNIILDMKRCALLETFALVDNTEVASRPGSDRMLSYRV